METGVILTFIGGIIGGGGAIKAYDIFIKNKQYINQSNVSTGLELRDELRADMVSIKEELKQLQHDYIELKSKYADLLIKNAHLESRANLYEEQAKANKIRADHNENEVERLKEVIKILQNE